MAQQGNGSAALEAPRAQGGHAVAREGFGTRELATTSEMATTAVATQMQAAVQARYVMALQRPRNVDQARLDLLASCKRRRFAEGARYALPKGSCRECKGGRGRQTCGVCQGTGKNMVRGFSVRFAEAALASWANVLAEKIVLSDDPQRRVVRAQVTDLERNLTFNIDVTMDKTVERRKVEEGQPFLGVRKNAFGDTVYLLPATEDEIRAKEAALYSRALRDAALRLLPGDLKEDAIDEIDTTLRTEANRDPAAERKRITDGFAQIGVRATDLAVYLGHELDTLTPAEMANLRALYAGIKEGEITWKDVMKDLRESEGSPDEKPAASRTAGLKDRLKGAKEPAPAPAAPASAPAPEAAAPKPAAAPATNAPASAQTLGRLRAVLSGLGLKTPQDQAKEVASLGFTLGSLEDLLEEEALHALKELDPTPDPK